MTALARLGAIAALALCAAAAFAQEVTLPARERVVLDNGAVLILSEKRDVPLVAATALLRGGAVTDPDGKIGVASLLATLLTKGAGDRDAAAFAEAVDGVGGRLTAAAGLETITVSADFLARDTALMVELLADMLLRPTLDAREFTRLRDREIHLIGAAKDSNLNALLPVYGHAFLFGAHPYGNPVGGSEATLAGIRHADVLRYYEQQLGGDRLVISVAGDFDADAMAELLRGAFGGWAPAGAALPEIPAAERRQGRSVLLIDKPGATQTYFWIANVGVARDYPQRAALDLANTIFGGRFTSMLNTELRVRSGLTYGARSRILQPTQPGSVSIHSYTRTDATTEAVDMALDVLGRLHSEVIDEDLLASAQNYVLGQFPTDFETAAQLAPQFATLEFYGLDSAWIDGYGADILAADAAALDAVIDEVYPSPDDVVLVLLGDAGEIREHVAKYGPVTEIPITDPRFRIE